MGLGPEAAHFFRQLLRAFDREGRGREFKEGLSETGTFGL